MGEKDRSGKQYERIVGSALKAMFGLGDGTHTGSLMRNQVMAGISGTGHEIDIVLETVRKDKRTLIAAECKDHGRPLEKEVVAAFHAVLQDMNALRRDGEKLKGMLVSSAGFQSGALDMGRYCGIMLLEIRRPDEREWKRYVRMILQEEQRRSPSGHIPEDRLTVDARTNERIVIVPDETRTNANKGWKLNTPLGRDAYSLVYTDQQHSARGVGLPELLRKQPSGGQGIHRKVVLKGTGANLHHLVWNEDMPVRRVEYTYDDLTGDLEDTIMYGRERPELLVFAPVNGWRGMIRKGRFELLSDPRREIREYDGKVKIHSL